MVSVVHLDVEDQGGGIAGVSSLMPKRTSSSHRKIFLVGVFGCDELVLHRIRELAPNLDIPLPMRVDHANII